MLDDQLVNRSTGQSVNWSIGQLVNRATGQSGNWSIGQLVNRSTGQSVNWSIGQLVNRSTGQSVNWSMDVKPLQLTSFRGSPGDRGIRRPDSSLLSERRLDHVTGKYSGQRPILHWKLSIEHFDFFVVAIDYLAPARFMARTEGRLEAGGRGTGR
jgi:hypothetical protein